MALLWQRVEGRAVIGRDSTSQGGRSAERACQKSWAGPALSRSCLLPVFMIYLGMCSPQALSVAVVRRVCRVGLCSLGSPCPEPSLPPSPGAPRGPRPRGAHSASLLSVRAGESNGRPQGQAPPKPQGRHVSRRPLSASGFPDEGLYESSKDSRPSAQKTSSFQVCRVCGPSARGYLGATDPRCVTSGLDSKPSFGAMSPTASKGLSHCSPFHVSVP